MCLVSISSGSGAFWDLRVLMASSISTGMKRISHILCPSRMLPTFLSCHVTDKDPSSMSHHLPITCVLNTHLPQSSTHHSKKPISHSALIGGSSLVMKYINLKTISLEGNLSHLSFPSTEDFSCMDEFLNLALVTRTLSSAIQSISFLLVICFAYGESDGESRLV